MRITVLGWYGHNNLGDDEIVLGGIKQLFQGSELSVFSDSPKAKYPLIDFKAVNDCDLFVLGGGELINENQLFISGAWSNQIKVPKLILGCGVNTEKAKHLSSLVIKELEQFSFIGVRDIHSLKLLRSFPSLRGKVELFYDCAFALDVAKFAVPRVDKPLSAVVVPTDRQNRQSDKGIKEFNLSKKSSKWLENQLSPFAHITFIPFGHEDNNDSNTCCELYHCSGAIENRSKSANIVHDEDVSLESVVRYISEASMVIPYRLHAMILAFMLRRNYAFYPYHQKLLNVHESLMGPPEAIKAWQKELFNTVMKDIS